MDLVNQLLEVLKEEHGGTLNLNEDVYYLFFKDALFTLYFDEDEKTIKVNVEFLSEENTHIYFREESIEKYTHGEEE